MNIDACKAALAHLDIEERDTAITAASRDFFWYSPVLKARLDHVVADFVVRPKNEAEVIEVLKTCYAHDVPVTTRGAGTGNYGQAMPLAGGCVMHLRHMDKVKEVNPGRVVCEPGVLLKDLDAHCQEDSGQELRMFSSTWSTATIGGFIAGGSGGVGSVHWGSLRDLGNIIRLRVVTMEEKPRVLEFRGEELARVSHAYGTNGIITELELPLAPAYDWTGIFVAADDFGTAMAFADELANEDGILLKIASVYEAPIAHSYFQRVKPHVGEGTNLVGLMVAPQSMDAFLTFLNRRPDCTMIYRSDDHDWPRHPGPVFEYGWNHTTLRALKFDSSITYLQVRYAFPEHRELIEKIRADFSPEVLQHLEAIRQNGKIGFAGLSLVKFTTEERLDEIIRLHEEAGALIFNPHRYTLEEGGRQHADPTQLNFKREADPKGLLNPGKMIAWDDPDWTYEKMYAYPQMRAAE
ncbi:FAD-binding oxidoreductase [Allosediminivita pacifica]|uniref:FAD/FMN-containing dehydrogenase n=1 Tax=Allosediminivita pacifica TaxID=1267769 RepID=A0A2T6B2M4_9RHOB|nr:FAD-binding oxidoreductase [Allosediminivita pacifica]PTX50330.1 FAD/FMN-containing dehydrogenase [Allosediminivita pacifica]GGB03244.1 FAD-linked oxidase [Allosediminivita pacifica]